MGSDEDEDDVEDDGKDADYDAAADFDDDEEDDQGGGDEFYSDHKCADSPSCIVDVNCWTHSIHLVFGDVAKSHPTISAAVATLKGTVT